MEARIMTAEASTAADENATGGSRLPASGDVIDRSAPLAENPGRALPGRLGPAGNSLRLGLTARSVLPDTLRLRTEQFAEKLRGELRPAGCLEDLLVAELARRAAGMELAGRAESRILRYCGQERLQLDSLLDGDGPFDEDASVTAAIANQPMERLVRYRRSHERGFYSALSHLRDLQATRHESTARAPFARFRDEQVCSDYLYERARRRAEVCPRCGHRHGHWLASRRWACSDCGLQVGLRCGSVMEGSRLPLSTWFLAIGEVLADPAIGPERLQQAIDLPRLGTVRKLLQEISAAIQSPYVDRLLAGLQCLAPRASPLEFCDAAERDLTKRT
jgi:hypothetical protein